MDKSVLIFIEDPGAANGLMHLSNTFEAQGVEINIYAAGYAQNYLAQRGYGYNKIEANTDEYAKSLILQNYDAVLLGTCENSDTFGFKLIEVAKTFNIPSFAFVDTAINSSYRFKGNSKNSLEYCPDYLLVTDNLSAEAFKKLGFSADRIFTVGHPHYEHVLHKVKAFTMLDRRQERLKLFGEDNSDKVIITFLSETLSGFDMKNYIYQPSWTLKGRVSAKLKLLIALESLLDSKALEKNAIDIHFVLRLHPKNTPEEFKVYSSKLDQLSQNGDPLKLVFFSDIICGVETSLLTEACLMGRPTISIQPDENIAKILPNVTHGVMDMVRTQQELENILEIYLNKNQQKILGVSYHHDSPSQAIVEKVLALS